MRPPTLTTPEHAPPPGLSKESLPEAWQHRCPAGGTRAQQEAARPPRAARRGPAWDRWGQDTRPTAQPRASGALIGRPPAGRDMARPQSQTGLLDTAPPVTLICSGPAPPQHSGDPLPPWGSAAFGQVPGDAGDQEVLDGGTVYHGQRGPCPGPALLLRLQPGRLLCHQAIAAPVTGKDLSVRGAERMDHWGSQRAGRRGVNVCLTGLGCTPTPTPTPWPRRAAPPRAGSSPRAMML